ncbi:hypothetical protein SPOG_04974 [Schizosaccharomyces cryophilus OY26]|uniref:Uncharacterized protein n=1 Tax=Schizosaccharomyces cryophilus (strain OY26 / ATCC MYA-4695 / CBS 11777 / NBRC 106824 / NRRL Y48691) TaxID=653667 RepID=S9W2I3_SCHCR|nr:uncharacterized protein SPOG_04974 [Schizosaccharomyces cryophilus OY26]EPY52240.1 hypothetical protein SPOG_04974 [Schizosaccharomyces cryophilus OY26]
MSEIRGMLQELREEMIQGQNSLQEGQNSLREVMIQGQRRLEGQLGSVNNNVQIN